MITFCLKVAGFCKKVFGWKVKEATGESVKKHGIIVVSVGLILAFCILAVVLSPFFALAEVSKQKVISMTASAYRAVLDLTTPPKTTREKDNESCILNKGYWTIWDGGALIRDKDGYSLPHDSPKGLFSYDIPLNPRGSYLVKFIPQGSQVNFSLLVPNLYEVIIGDGDYQTVTVKKSDAVEAPPSVTLEEGATGLLRPMLAYKIKPGTQVNAKVDEDMTENKITLNLEVTYLPDIGNSPDRKIEKFKYEFSPAVPESGTHELVLGLFRVLKAKDKAIVRVQFVCPRI